MLLKAFFMILCIMCHIVDILLLHPREGCRVLQWACLCGSVCLFTRMSQKLQI